MPIFRALLQNEPDSLYDKNCHQNSVFSWTVIDCTIYGALCCHLSSLIRTQRAFNKWQGKESTFLIDLNDSIESQHYIPWPKPAARRGNGKNIFHLSANNITYSTTHQAKIENEYKNCWLHGRRPFRYPPAQRYRRRVPTYRYIYILEYWRYMYVQPANSKQWNIYGYSIALRVSGAMNSPSFIPPFGQSGRCIELSTISLSFFFSNAFQQDIWREKTAATTTIQ